MLVVADVKALEVVTCAYLSNDPLLISEIKDGIDIHAVNQKQFKLPERVIAKRFTFKMIYGGTSFGFSRDPEFIHVSRNPDFWQSVIDRFYEKYEGIHRWHETLVRMAIETGRYESPSGRIYVYPIKDVIDRLWYWRPKILNYPVQGLGADLVMIGRISAYRRIKASNTGALMVSSVHDSIVVDSPNEVWYNIGKILSESIRDIPANFQRLFNRPFDIPMTSEIKYGQTLGDLQVANYDHKD